MPRKPNVMLGRTRELPIRATRHETRLLSHMTERGFLLVCGQCGRLGSHLAGARPSGWQLQPCEAHLTTLPLRKLDFSRTEWRQSHCPPWSGCAPRTLHLVQRTRLVRPAQPTRPAPPMHRYHPSPEPASIFLTTTHWRASKMRTSKRSTQCGSATCISFWNARPPRPLPSSSTSSLHR